jgi:hypothetical protein
VTAKDNPTIRCDAPNPESSDGQCDTEWGWPGPVANHTELRRKLRADGWLRPRPGRDICPNCAEKGLR